MTSRHLVQYAGFDKTGTLRHVIEREDVLRWTDFTGWRALTFRDLDTHQAIDQPTNGRN